MWLREDAGGMSHEDVGGPRQVGKTTFALGFLGKDADEKHPAYLNWDHPSVPRD